MKFSSFAVLFSFTSVALAIDLNSIPQCALACFAQGAASAGCSLNDLKCQCTTGKEALTRAVTPCIAKTCNADDSLRTAAAATSICDEVAKNGGGSVASGTAALVSATTSAKTTASTGAASAHKAGALGAGAAMVAALLL